MTWMNWACLGATAANVSGLPLPRAARRLDEDLAAVRRWAAAWCGRPLRTILLTAGTVDGCDVALRAAGMRHARVLLHTDVAHPTVSACVRSAAAFWTEVTGRTVRVAEVAVADAVAAGPRRFASVVAERVQRAARGERGVFVLEHVTSDAGWLLPLALVERRLRARAPRLTVLADGAQATGLWPVPQQFRGAYVGCFHKYADGPAGCGFIAIEGSPDSLPYAPVGRSSAGADGGCAPTEDAQKWARCRRALITLGSPALARAHQRATTRLWKTIAGRSAALNQERRRTPPPLRSHILAVELGDEARARNMERALARSSQFVRRTGRALRVSLSHRMTSTEARAFADAFERIAPRYTSDGRDGNLPLRA